MVTVGGQMPVAAATGPFSADRALPLSSGSSAFGVQPAPTVTNTATTRTAPDLDLDLDLDHSMDAPFPLTQLRRGLDSHRRTQSRSRQTTPMMFITGVPSSFTNTQSPACRRRCRRFKAVTARAS